MKIAIKPDGLIAIEDIEFSGHFCYPPCEAFDRYIELYQQIVKNKGGDSEIGTKLPEMIRQVGFKQVNLNVIQPNFMEEEGKLIAQITKDFEKINKNKENNLIFLVNTKIECYLSFVSLISALVWLD